MKYSYIVQGIEDDVIKSLRTGKPYKKIFIESGAANDEIIDYDLSIRESVNKRSRECRLRTTAAIFPGYINLSDYDDVETEEFQGNLFIHIQ